MTEAEFRALAAQGYNRIPLVLETFADLDTPLSLYIKLANQRYTFLLESVVGGERFGRYSFIGLARASCASARAAARSRSRTTVASIERHHGDPLAFIGDFLRRYRAAPQPGLPRFCGGAGRLFRLRHRAAHRDASSRDRRRPALRHSPTSRTSCCC